MKARYAAFAAILTTAFAGPALAKGPKAAKLDACIAKAVKAEETKGAKFSHGHGFARLDIPADKERNVPAQEINAQYSARDDGEPEGVLYITSEFKGRDASAWGRLDAAEPSRYAEGGARGTEALIEMLSPPVERISASIQRCVPPKALPGPRNESKRRPVPQKVR